MASEAIRARRDAEQRELGYQRAEREIAALRADLARAHFERDSAARDCVDAEAQCDGLRAEVAERTRERDDAIARHLKSDWCRERAEAKIATFVAQAKRIAGAHARDNDVHGEAAALYEAIAAAFTATASGPEGGDDAG